MSIAIHPGSIGSHTQFVQPRQTVTSRSELSAKAASLREGLASHRVLAEPKKLAAKPRPERAPAVAEPPAAVGVDGRYVAEFDPLAAKAEAPVSLERQPRAREVPTDVRLSRYRPQRAVVPAQTGRLISKFI